MDENINERVTLGREKRKNRKKFGITSKEIF